MEKYKVSARVFDELESATKQHPIWPENIFEAIAIITEEVGELSQAALDHKHKNGDYQNVIDEAVQVAAMGIRFLLNHDKYKQ